MNKKIKLVLFVSFILLMGGCANKTQTIQKDNGLLEKSDVSFSLEIGDEFSLLINPAKQTIFSRGLTERQRYLSLKKQGALAFF